MINYCNMHLNKLIAAAVAAMCTLFWLAGAETVHADMYYDTTKVYTEGIFIDEDLYVEPCFEHFTGEEKNYKALMVSGDMPAGTQYRLYSQTEPKAEDVQTSESIPKISEIGVHRIDILMPGKDPVTFQAEIVLEGLIPGCYTGNGEQVAGPSLVFTDEPRRDTYNIRRDEDIAVVPQDYDLVIHHFEDYDLIYDHIRGLTGVRAHFISLDISGGALAGSYDDIHIGTYVYPEKYSFASENEMYDNRETFGE